MRQAEPLQNKVGIINFVAIQLLVKSTETIAQTNGDNILHIQPVFVSIIVKPTLDTSFCCKIESVISGFVFI
jgi:hypothetical protein